MTIDLSGLDVKAPSKKQWRPPSAADLEGPEIRLLCFDQSLNSTGFVVLSRSRARNVEIEKSVTLRGESAKGDLTGFEADYARALHTEDLVSRVLYQWADPGLSEIIHETPPVGSKKIPGAGISSRMAGQAIRSAASGRGLARQVVMLNAQQAKTFVCGNSKADKAEAHAAMRQHFGYLPGFEMVTNEHERDALLLGLLRMARTRA